MQLKTIKINVDAAKKLGARKEMRHKPTEYRGGGAMDVLSRVVQLPELLKRDGQVQSLLKREVQLQSLLKR